MTFWCYEAPRRPSLCRFCRASLIWLKTERGKWMPFNGHPVAVRTKLVEGALLGEYDSATVHWATCPDADAFRRTHER